jgi:hypothetical protein
MLVAELRSVGVQKYLTEPYIPVAAGLVSGIVTIDVETHLSVWKLRDIMLLMECLTTTHKPNARREA